MRTILAANIALILLGSYFPFDFDWSLSDRPVAGLSVLPGRSDMLANALLFMPFSFVLWFMRPGRAELVLWILLGCLVAVFAQVGQIYIPARSPAVWDVLTNIIGLVAGAMLAMLVRPRLNADVADWRLPLPALLSIICLLGYQLVPYAPSLDVGALRASAKVFWYSPWDWLTAVRAFFYILGLYCVIQVTQVKYPRTVFVAVTALVLLGKPLVIGSGSTIAGHSGFALALLVGLSGVWRIQWLAAAVAVALMGIYVWDGLTPWQWRVEPAKPDFTVVRTLVQGSWLANITVLFWKCFLFSSALVLLADRGRHTLISVVTVIACAATVELAQIFLSSGTPSLSDPVIVLVLALLLFERSFRNHRTP